MTHIVIQKWSCNRCGRSQERETVESDWTPEGWRSMFLGDVKDDDAPGAFFFVAHLCPTCHDHARKFVAGAELAESEMT